MRKNSSPNAAPARQPAPPVSGSHAAGTDADALLQGLPWGVVVLDAQGTVLRLNQQAAYWWGASSQALLGQRLGPATAGTLPPDLQQALRLVPSELAPPPGAFFLPQQQRWISMASAREADRWVVYWQDITAQKQREIQDQTREAASDLLLRRTEAVARTGSYELELATGQLHFSNGLFRLLGEEPGAFVPDVAAINARSCPADVALIEQVLAQAIADRQPYYYQRRIYRPDGQLRTLEVHGRVECDAQGQPAKLLGLLQDVTEREQATQEILRVKDELTQRATENYTALYSSMDEGFCIVEVLFDNAKQPVDYRFLDVNPAFEKHTGLCGALSKTIGELVPAIEPLWADMYSQVSRTGEPIRFEANVESMGRWFDLNAFPIGPLPDHQVGVVFTDITARKQTEEALRQFEEQFRLLVTATSDTVYRMSADWTHMEQLIGKDFLADTLHPTHTWVEAYIPADDLPHVQAAIAEAICHKRPFELEHRVRQADGTLGWTYSRAIPMLDAQGELTGWLGAARDVSASKQAEAQLEQQVAERTQALGESQTRLQSVFESTTTSFVLLQAVRDVSGHLLDFEYELVNPIAQGYHASQPLVGQRFGMLHPGVYHTPIFAHFAAVIETGRRTDFEVLYDHEGYNHWFRLVGEKLGDGLLYTAEDITARKLLEQAQTKSLALLQESEEVAGMGSWDYDLHTKKLIWSDGLYHLLGRVVGSPVKPQFFLDAVLDDDRPQAARLVRILAAGADRFDELLRLRVGEAVKTVRCKAVPLPSASGPPVRVLGVCLDVSDLGRLEAENSALKLDQHKELLLAILQAQETERERLGEVLHNSLGQVLYATKLRLDQMDTPALHALPALAALHQQTDRLLTEVMRQTRTLAHELVPTSLTNFGLAVAVRDVCRDLSTPQLHLECQVWGEEQELPQPIQVALFRLAQELAHNIGRHAGATRALLELETMPGWVSLRAEDNGRGFDPQTVTEGLGLRTVRDTVALLGGSVAIDSSPEFGTHVRLRIPLPLFS
jgi:signal transduction histidine kinase